MKEWRLDYISALVMAISSLDRSRTLAREDDNGNKNKNKSRSCVV